MKIVLIDLDDTLLIAPAANKDASKVMFKKVFDVDAHEQMIHTPGKTEDLMIRQVLEKIGKKVEEVPQEAYEVWAKAAEEGLKIEPAQVLPGAKDLLEGFVKEGIVFGVITGNSRRRAEAKLVSAGLDTYFRDEHGSLRGAFGDTDVPREELIDVAKKNMGQEDSLAIIVDDSSFVVNLIQKYDLPHVMIATGDVPFEELKKKVKHAVKSLDNNGWREVIEIVKNEY